MPDSRLFVIRLFHRHGDTPRSDLDEIREVFALLQKSPVRTRLAVGVGVRLSNELFAEHFPGLGAYLGAPGEERRGFCSRLADLEARLAGYAVGMAVGAGLYRLWLDRVEQSSRPVADILGEHLTHLSREASRIKLTEELSRSADSGGV